MSIIDDLIEVGKILYYKNLVVGRVGNISARVEGGFIITSSGSSLGNLKIDDFVFLNREGEVREGKRPSMETPLHLEIYKNLFHSLFIFPKFLISPYTRFSADCLTIQVLTIT